MRTLNRVTALSVCLSALLAVSPAQQPASPDAVVTNLPATKPPILLDVLVTDKSGKPITGLQQQDFTVLDNKHPAAITAFHTHDATALPSDQIDASTELIFIIDEANAPYTRAIYARQGVENYLKDIRGQLTHPVSVGLFTDSGLSLQSKPTIDGNALVAALEKEGQTYRAIDRGAVGGDFDRLQFSLNAIDTLIATEEQKPGRKVVIWISPGWPLFNGLNDPTTKQQQQIFGYITNLSTRLRNARITFYSIDPLGAGGTGEHSVLYQNFTKPVIKPDKAYFGDIGLQVLVDQTGGRAIFGNDPIAVSIEHELTDLSAFYTLSIPPASADSPNQFHNLEVQVSRPNLKVRTRNGYYAQP